MSILRQIEGNRKSLLRCLGEYLRALALHDSCQGLAWENAFADKAECEFGHDAPVERFRRDLVAPAIIAGCVHELALVAGVVTAAARAAVVWERAMILLTWCA